jgi:glycerol kinase
MRWEPASDAEQRKTARARWAKAVERTLDWVEDV